MRPKLLLLAAALSVSGLAQTTVRLRDHGPGFYVTGASNTTPIVIQTGAPHGFVADDVGATVDLWNVPFDDGSGRGWLRYSKQITCGNAGANVLYGDFKIAAVIDSTHFSINDLAGNPVPARGVWCDGGGGVDNGGPQWGGKTNPYALASGPRGWYDGDTGTYTRRLALGTGNGLTSLTVAASVATAVTSFDNYIADGAQIAVWGSGNTALDNNHAPYIVRVDSPRQFHFGAPGVPDGVYTNSNNACGPSKNADCFRLSSLAITGNPFWDRVVATFQAYTGQRAIHDGGNSAFSPFNGGGATYPNVVSVAAMVLLVDQGNASALSDVLYAIQHVEHFLSTAWVLDETQNNGGYANWSDTISYLFYGMANMYAVGKPYLSAADRQTFLDKMWNDITDPGGGCIRSLPIQKAGATIAYDGVSTITGTGTLWMSDADPSQRAAVGDVIFKPSFYSAVTEYYVTAVNSDTSLTVVTTPRDTTAWANQTFILYHKWTAGTCGAIWFKKHWLGAGSHPVLYPPTGGDYQTWFNSPTRYHPASASNNAYTWSKGMLALAAATADDDPRAAQRFEEAQSYFFDWMLPTSLSYTTGFQHSGSYYSWGRTVPDASEAAMVLANSVPGFPDLGFSTPWITQPPMLKLYGLLPDNYTNLYWPVRWGSETGDNHVRSNACEYTLDSVGRLAPQSDAARLFKTWRLGLDIARDCAAEEFLSHGDPAIGQLDYKTLPTQHLFRATSQAICNALGMNCPATTRGDGVISRTGWNSLNDTHVTFLARSFIGDHDVPQPGALHIYKRGPLVQDGRTPPGAFSANDDTSVLEGVLVFGEANRFYSGQPRSDGRDGIASIDRWSGADPIGDAQSRYFYAEADVAGMYKASINRAKVHAVHFKNSATDEIVLQYFDVDVSGSPTSVRGQIHYSQNGEAGNDYTAAEGTTTCPGQSGCAGLDTDRIILSQESGAPGYTNGVVTRIFSPGSITLRYDGSTYTGNLGHDVRVSICGGSSCGSAVSAADWLVVHKVTSTLADRDLPAVPLNPDPKWTGVQTASTVALFSRNGNLPILVNFQTTHTGTAQYLIAGLEGGHTYRVHRIDDGADVASLPVVDGDNSLYFEATAGSYQIFPAELGNLFLKLKPPGNIW